MLVLSELGKVAQAMGERRGKEMPRGKKRTLMIGS